MSATILHGDCVAMMSELPDASIDAIVTDPPYELGFMGKHWDASGVAYNVATWAAAFRVLKPGGHLLAFGGTRTYHRMACAIEDAGFEIRDQLQWLYGSGFPKSHDVSKAIDKAAGAERDVVGRARNFGASQLSDGKLGYGDYAGEWDITVPATPDAERWQGWGTALKPANEPIVLARKPLSEPTVAANVLRWGTGAINVDATRIPHNEPICEMAAQNEYTRFYGQGGRHEPTTELKASGRWPANVILSHSLFCTDDACDPSCPVAMLDAQSGASTSRIGKPRRSGTPGNGYGMVHTGSEYSDAGGASRFFYVAKASRKERRTSTHPTVKPVALMRYLIRLIAPPGGVVLDPFAGSGTTGEAALLEGVDCVLIEREDEYIADIRARLESVAELETAAD